MGECGHGFNHPPDPQCGDCWLLIISGYQGRRTFGVPAWADTGALTRLSLPPGLLGSQGRRAGSDWPRPGCCAGASLAGCSTQFQRVSRGWAPNSGMFLPLWGQGEGPPCCWMSSQPRVHPHAFKSLSPSCRTFWGGHYVAFWPGRGFLLPHSPLSRFKGV